MHTDVERLTGFKNLSRHGIRRWRMVLVASVGLVLLALMALWRIPRLEDPRVETGEVQIAIPYPGASAEDVEALVLKIFEPELRGVDGVESVEATAVANAATFVVRMREGAPIDVIAERLRGRLQARRGEVPSHVGEPDVFRVTTALLPQMVIAVAGNRSEMVLTEWARKLSNDLLAIQGVSGAELRGEQLPAVRIRLDPERLAAHGLTTDGVVQTLRSANVRIAAGDLEIGGLRSVLEIDEEARRAEDISALPLDVRGAEAGASLHLDEIADVADATRTPDIRFLDDGLPAVAVQIRFRQDADAVHTGELVRARLTALRETLPAGMRLRVTYDQPHFVEKSLASLLSSLVEGVALVMGIVTLGMGWRAALVVAGVLPLALGGALLGLYLLGMSLDQVSITGLIVGIGLLVDDAVVVAESIQLMCDKGFRGARAAVVGAARVFSANNATTVIACASFVPLFFSGAVIGLFVRGLAAAVILALLTSLAVAQLVTPVAAAFLLRGRFNGSPLGRDVPLNPEEDCAAPPADEPNPALRALRLALARVGPPLLRRPWRVLAVACAALVVAILSMQRIGFAFFPKHDKPLLFVRVDLDRGSSVELTARKTFDAAAIIRQQPTVEHVSAVIGGGYPRVFAGRVAPRDATDVGDALVEVAEEANLERTARDLRERLATIPGARCSVEQLYYGPPVPHSIQLRVVGDDYPELAKLARTIETELAPLPHVVNVTDSLRDTEPVARVRIDRERAARAGVSPAQIGATLRALYGQDRVTEFRRRDERVDVVLDTRATPDAPLDAVAATLLPTGSGTRLPLRAVGDVQISHEYSELRRRNGRRMVEISADVEGGALPTAIAAQLERTLRMMQWPQGYSWEFGGDRAEIERSFRYLGIASAAALLSIGVLLVLLFDSFALTLAVLLAVPFGLIGGVLGLGLSGSPFSFIAFLGLLSLLGVYVNHKVYFVDRVRELVGRGATLRVAMLQAGQDRLRPVVLTALTAVLGLLPLAARGGPLWAAFGWVNIVGLLASIPLSLLVLPAVVTLTWPLRRFSGQEAPRG